MPEAGRPIDEVVEALLGGDPAAIDDASLDACDPAALAAALRAAVADRDATEQRVRLSMAFGVLARRRRAE